MDRGYALPNRFQDGGLIVEALTKRGLRNDVRTAVAFTPPARSTHTATPM